MALQPFTWGSNGQKASPSSVKKHAEIAAALAARGGAPQSFGEGLNRVGEALLAKSYEGRAAAGEAEGAASRKAVMDALLANADPTMADLAGAYGNDWVTSDPGSSAVLQALMGAEIQQNDPLRQLQIQQAQQGLEMGGIELENARNPQPELPEAPEVKTIFDPESGREQVVQWNAQTSTWEPIGGVQAPKDPLVQVNTGSMGPKLGSLSTDYGYVLGPDGQPVIDPETGLPKAAPVPGSPAAREIEAAAAAQIAGGEQDTMYADIVSEDIGRALTLLESDPTFTTGFFGQVLGNLRGSNAERLDQFLNTVRSNVAFDRLQAMREASPTGGALGSVTEGELSLLESTIGSLERSNPDDLAYNLKRVQEIYDRVMEKAAAYPNAGQFGFGGKPNQSTVDPNDIDALLELYK